MSRCRFVTDQSLIVCLHHITTVELACSFVFDHIAKPCHYLRHLEKTTSDSLTSSVMNNEGMAVVDISSVSVATI